LWTERLNYVPTAEVTSVTDEVDSQDTSQATDLEVEPLTSLDIDPLFQPDYEAASRVIQKWWRQSRTCDKWIKIVMELKTKDFAAKLIQKSFRRYLNQKEIQILAQQQLLEDLERELREHVEQESRDLVTRDRAAQKIQVWWKSIKMMINQRNKFINLKQSVLTIERYHHHSQMVTKWRLLVEQVTQRDRDQKVTTQHEARTFRRRASAATVIARAWRRFVDVRDSRILAATLIQRWFRSEQFKQKVTQREWSRLIDRTMNASPLEVEGLLRDPKYRLALIFEPRVRAARVLQRAWRLRLKVTHCVPQILVVNPVITDDDPAPEIRGKGPLYTACYHKLKNILARAKELERSNIFELEHLS
jgi:hypothetical protein